MRKRALARAIRMRHPPLKDLVGCCCMALVKPSPCKMELARCSAVAASNSSKLLIGGRRRGGGYGTKDETWQLTERKFKVLAACCCCCLFPCNARAINSPLVDFCEPLLDRALLLVVRGVSRGVVQARRFFLQLVRLVVHLE